VARKGRAVTVFGRRPRGERQASQILFNLTGPGTVLQTPEGERVVRHFSGNEIRLVEIFSFRVSIAPVA